MIHTTNIFAAPVMLVLGLLDTYLFLLGVRLIAGRVAASSRFTKCLRQLTDRIPQHVDRCIAGKRSKPNPRWLSWVVVIVAGMIVRHFLVSILVTL